MSQPQNTPTKMIRASEIGQYCYCAKAWWLGSVMAVPSTNVRELAQGETAHSQHGQKVWWAGALRALALGLVVIALVALFVSFF